MEYTMTNPKGKFHYSIFIASNSLTIACKVPGTPPPHPPTEAMHQISHASLQVLVLSTGPTAESQVQFEFLDTRRQKSVGTLSTVNGRVEFTISLVVEGTGPSRVQARCTAAL